MKAACVMAHYGICDEKPRQKSNLYIQFRKSQCPDVVDNTNKNN